MSARKYILDANRQPVVAGLLAWAEWFERGEEVRRVAATTAIPGTWVSTVFPGLDHRWGDGPPLLFETMAFGDDQAANEIVGTRRCGTWDEAEAQHVQAVAELSTWHAKGAVR